MIISTLAYIEKNEKFLMLYRNKKENDINEGKWVGVGGKLEANESPDECIKREIYEETGLKAEKMKLRGFITFVNTICESELIFIYTVSDYSGDLIDCNEGTLEWIDKEKVLNLNLWEGDRYFLTPILKNEDKFINIKFVYDADNLIEVLEM